MKGEPRETQAGLPLLLLLNLAVRLAFVARPLKYIDSLTLPDDTYISLEIARNIAHGHGPWYGLDFTNGFQPLYVFLMVPAYWIWPTNPVPPVHAALVLLTLFDTVTLWVLFRWIERLTGSRSAAWAVGLAWALNPYVIGESLNGLETAIAVCFLAASFATFDSLVKQAATNASTVDWSEARLVRRLGFLLGFTIFARVDGLLLAAVLGIGLIVVWLRAGRRPAAIAMACVQVAVIAILVNAPRCLYSLHYTGEWLPGSGEAVRFVSLSDVNHDPTSLDYYVHQLRRGGLAVWNGNGPLLVGIGLAGTIAWLGRPRSKASPASRESHAATVYALLAWAVLLFGAYTLYIFGPWFYDRYLFPIVVPLLVIFGIAVDRAVRALAARSPRVETMAATTAIALAAAGGLGQTRLVELYTSTETFSNGYMNLGLWARKHFPPGTRVGSSQTGALAYFAPELVVVNLDGVVNRACMEALREFRGLDYIRSVGVQYVINWEEGDMFLMNHSRGATGKDLPVVEHILEFGSWHHPWLVFEVKSPQNKVEPPTLP